MRFSPALLLAFAALSAVPVNAQSLAELRVQSAGQSGFTLALESVERQGGVETRRVLAWGERPSRWLYERGSGTQRNLDEPPKLAGGPVVWSVSPTAGDTWIVGVDSIARSEQVKPSELLAFLKRGGHAEWDEALGVRKESCRVSILESHKLLLRSDSESDTLLPGPSAMSKSGQRAELRPVCDPTSNPPGSALPLRVYLPEGYPKEQVVLATHLVSGAALRAQSSADGIVHLVLDRAGVWSVEVNGVRRLAPGQPAEWEICRATLRFTAPRAPNPKPATRQGDKR